VFIWKRLLCLVTVLLGGCAQGFDRDALRERLNDGTLQSPDAAIVEARTLKPQLRFPCRIAVHLKPSNDRNWRWTPEDKAAMEQWATALKAEGIATDVFPLPELLAGKGEAKELRLAAAQCGADVLFVIHGAAQTDSYKNFAAVLNLTVVGGYVIPASHKDSLFMMEGVLLDVDNGYIYTGVQAEGVGKIVRPTFVIEEKDAIAQAKTKAVAQFGEEVLKRMRAVATGPAVNTGACVRSSVSDINAQGVTIGLTPTGTYAPDIDVSLRGGPNAGGAIPAKPAAK
jgi:rhombotail lipoprotein